MKLKLLLLSVSFIPTVSFAAGALMQLEVPAFAPSVISERPDTADLPPKVNEPNFGGSINTRIGTSETSKKPLGEHAFDSGLTSRGGNQTTAQGASKKGAQDCAFGGSCGGGKK